jgi:molybdopterin converting factor small subunit
MALVKIPAALRYLADGQAECVVDGETLGEVLRGLVRRHPRLGPKLLEEGGKMFPGLLVVLGGEDGRAIRDEGTALEQDAVLTIYPLVAGG